MRTIFASGGLTRAIIAMVSGKFGNVVGSASPLSAMSFKRKQFARHGTEWRMLRDLARTHHLQHLAQLLLGDRQLKLFHRGFRCAIDLAVNTVEIAGFCRG